jgi:hypothetical protein
MRVSWAVALSWRSKAGSRSGSKARTAGEPDFQGEHGTVQYAWDSADFWGEPGVHHQRIEEI